MLDEQDKQWIENLLDTRLDAMEQSITVKLEVMETKLLTAFHGWASPVEARLPAVREAIRALDIEVESIDKRVKKLEGR